MKYYSFSLHLCMAFLAAGCQSNTPSIEVVTEISRVENSSRPQYLATFKVIEESKGDVKTIANPQIVIQPGKEYDMKTVNKDKERKYDFRVKILDNKVTSSLLIKEKDKVIWSGKQTTSFVNEG